MDIRSIRTLSGPNIWSRRPALEAWVDLGALEDTASNSVPGFTERLMAAVPSLIEHRCSIGERGGFLQRLRTGTYPAHILEHTTLELQTLAGTPVGFGKARETSEHGVYRVVVRYEEEALGRACLLTARELLLACLEDRPFDIDAALARLRALADTLRPPPRVAALLAAALARGIPVRRLDEGDVLELGHGIHYRRVRPDDGHDPAEVLLDRLYPDGGHGRIPIASVTGTNGKTIVARLLAHLLGATGRTLALATSDGLTVGGVPVSSADATDAPAARDVLRRRDVELAVLESSAAGILHEGLGFDRCDVAVVTNIAGADHLGESSIETPEEMYTVKRCAVDVLQPHGAAVLAADDPLVARMVELFTGTIVLFGRDLASPVLAAHTAVGGRAATVHDGWLVLVEGAAEHRLLPVADLPLAHGGRVPFQVENALAAAAAAWSLGLAPEAIAVGLASFPGVPGRFEVRDRAGVTVVVDAARNPSAVAALVAALDRFPSGHRTIVETLGPVLRPDVLVQRGALLGAAFDRVVLCADGPAAGAAHVRQGIATGSRCSEVRESEDVPGAIAEALRSARPGDVLVLRAEGNDLARLARNASLASSSEPSEARPPLGGGGGP